MTLILIADSSKPSLVMSSEVFKDKIAGANILVATTGKQCIEILSQSNPDMCVVDFDLPDTDGIVLIKAMRKTYKGPILLTAFPDKNVEAAAKSDLFAWGDAGGWVPKPVRFEVLSEKIDKYLLDKHRIGKRFDISIETIIIGKGAGRGKRAPKANGKITNLSLGGCCIELDTPIKFKNGEEMMVSLSFPNVDEADSHDGRSEKLLKSRAASTLKVKEQVGGADAKIKCTVAWIDKKCTRAGIQFNKLTDTQKKGLEEILRAVHLT
jgi:CheY-like chemotaxis protein